MENDTVKKLKQLGIYEHVLELNRKHGLSNEKEDAGSRLLPEAANQNLKVISPKINELEKHYIYVYPKTIEEIKRLTGVDEQVCIANAKERDGMNTWMLMKSKTMDIRTLAYRFLILSEAEIKEMLQQTESEYTIEDIKKYILNKSKILPVFCMGGTLDVKDGETVEIKDTATAVFETVLIHGSGTIRPDSCTKIVITDELIHDV